MRKPYPVPNVVGWLRHPKTTQERRENQSWEEEGSSWNLWKSRYYIIVRLKQIYLDFSATVLNPLGEQG
jgi:hypothetical protein